MSINVTRARQSFDSRIRFNSQFNRGGHKSPVEAGSGGGGGGSGGRQRHAGRWRRSRSTGYCAGRSPESAFADHSPPAAATAAAPAAHGPAGAIIDWPGAGVASRSPRHFGPKARDHVGPAALVRFQFHDSLGRRIFQQFAERPVAVIALVERRLFALDRVLDHRRPQHLLVFAPQRQQRFEQQFEGLALRLGQLRIQLRNAGIDAAEVLVVDELIAIVAQKL